MAFVESTKLSCWWRPCPRRDGGEIRNGIYWNEMQENDQAQVLTIYICARARLFFDKTSLQQKNSVHSAGISRQKFFLLFFSFENDRQRRQKSRRTDSTRGNIQWHSGHRTKWSSSARNVDGRKRCRALSLSLSLRAAPSAVPSGGDWQP